MDLGLAKKNVLITGSTKGVGLATAELFAKEGANPIIVGRSEEEIERITLILRDRYSVNASGITCDLSKEGEAERLYEECIKRKGFIDILVNNAGIWPTAYVKDMEKKNLKEPCILIWRFPIF